MTLLEYIEWRLVSLQQSLEAKSGIKENDNLDDLRISSQISELNMLKENLKNGQVHCS